MKKKNQKYFGIYKEADRDTRVKMYKSGKQWVCSLLSQISLFHFLKIKGKEENQRIVETDYRKSSAKTKELLKGLTAMGALTGGAYAMQQTAFADTNPGSVMTSNATTSTLATTDKVNLTPGVADSSSLVNQGSNSQSKDQPSLSESLSESSSTSTSISKSESLSTSISQSERLSESVSTSKSQLSTDSTAESKTSTASTSEGSLLEGSNSEISVNSEVATGTEKVKLGEYKTVGLTSNLLTTLNESKITTTNATNASLFRRNLMLLATNDTTTNDQLVSDVNLKIYVDSTIEPQKQGTLAIGGSMHINDGAQTGDTITVQLSNNLNLNGISADGTKQTMDLVAPDGSIVATSSYDATTNQLTFTLTDYVQTHTNINASFVSPAWIDMINVPFSGSQTLTISMSGSTNSATTYVSYFKPRETILNTTGISTESWLYNVGNGHYTQTVYVNQNGQYLYGNNGLGTAYTLIGGANPTATSPNAIEVNANDTSIKVYRLYDNVTPPESMETTDWSQYGVDVTSTFNGYISYANNHYTLQFAPGSNRYVVVVEGSYDSTANESGSGIYTRNQLFANNSNYYWDNHNVLFTGTGQASGEDTYNSVSVSLSESTSASTSHSISQSTSTSESASTSASLSTSTSKSLSTSTSESLSASTSESLSASTSESLSASTSESLSASTSESLSASTSESLSASTSESLSASTSESLSASTSESLSASTSESLSASTSESLSASISESLSASTSESLSASTSESLSASTSEPLSASTSESLSASTSESLSASTSESLSTSMNESSSQSTSLSLSMSRVTDIQYHSGVYTWKDADQVIKHNVNNLSATKQTEKLPQTGNAASSSMTTIGLIMAGIATLAGIKRSKKKK
ncbi:Ig-like domain-containing protein [Limosilactobacillus gastricus]|uniref:Ig-like domain-containing protein n=1 Tax=Limosilactobacillus gastricus TaxID=227942 RepID=UPI0026EAE103|nr:Ig-like domain-containing protein [Limosilactobacillus gastricus]